MEDTFRNQGEKHVTRISCSSKSFPHFQERSSIVASLNDIPLGSTSPDSEFLLDEKESVLTTKNVELDDKHLIDDGVLFTKDISTGEGRNEKFYSEDYLIDSPDMTRTYPDSAETYPTKAKIYPDSAEIYPTKAKIYQDSAEIYPVETERVQDSAEIYPTKAETYPDSAETYPNKAETYPVEAEINSDGDIFQYQKRSEHLLYRDDDDSVYKMLFHVFSVRADSSQDGGSIGCCGYILWFLSIVIIGLTLPFSLCLCIKVVQEYERAVIFRLGRLLSGGAKGPGLFFIIPCIDAYTKVDIRTVSFDVPPQEVLTKDSVTVAVDAVVYYRVQNATMSITNVEDANRSTRLLAATTLRNVLGTKNLAEILSERESISHTMQKLLDDATDPWGVKVERVEVKDVRLPVQLQRAMAAEAEAAREARAKVIAAEGEQKASRALKEAADVMVESPAALQLRYLQTLNTISAEKNSTIIFPLPIDFLQSFMPKTSHM
ncbi:hypothetical protein KUTeg_022174 [Tegillarca granosa]|uniref:Band 7 domain-containing protein n=2 Tax=Tegillarca granosa TaxID=220873 RepID=A0ABQ9EAX2_TEGGR|nr:hypothetical protein KUTeg_022174 [Tegillarca granosa]